MRRRRVVCDGGKHFWKIVICRVYDIYVSRKGPALAVVSIPTEHSNFYSSWTYNELCVE